MKKKISTFIVIASLAAFSIHTIPGIAQDDKSKRPSPPAQVSEMIGSTAVTVDYSQPGVKGRTIWGELVPYGKVWRTGANEATTFEVNKDVKVEGENLPAGKYALFTIPEKDEWTIIFNSVPEQWGAYNYDNSKDILRVKVKPEKSSSTMERLTFTIDKKGVVALHWEDLMVGFNVSAE
jgi:hypothetical protein